MIHERVACAEKCFLSQWVHTLALKDGSVQMGFITLNSADIAKRDKSETLSLMPPGLVGTLSLQDFASPLDYLEVLAKEPAMK